MNLMEPRTLFVEPSDVLLFRDGRPFSAGSDHFASGTFPPSPIPLYGALRSAAFASSGVRFKRNGLSIPPGAPQALGIEMGSWDRLGTMEISFFSLAHLSKNGCKLLFPRPLDVVRVDADSQRFTGKEWLRFVPHVQRGSVKARANFPVNSFRPMWHKRHEKVRFDDADYFVDQDSFGQYLLSGTLKPFKHRDEDNDEDGNQWKPKKPFGEEIRTSLEIEDGTLRADDGKLYSVFYTRVRRNIGFAVALKNASTLPSASGLLRLGGESRIARYEDKGLPVLGVKEEVRKKVKESKRCALVLTTPAPFSNGWLPDFIDKNGQGTYKGCTFKLVGCAVERHQNIGGWDIARNCPRPARPASPPGSVYFFEALEGDIDLFFDNLFGRSVCSEEDDQKRGLGLAYLGYWD